MPGVSWSFLLPMQVPSQTNVLPGYEAISDSNIIELLQPCILQPFFVSKFSALCSIDQHAYSLWYINVTCYLKFEKYFH